MAGTRPSWGPVFGSLILATATLGGQTRSGVRASGDPPRPRVLGISHVALRASDLPHARQFYEDFLGYGTETATGKEGSQTLRIAVDDHQYIELRAGLRPDEDRLDHVALETEDVQAMRRYLASRGVDVPGVTREASGNRCFMVRDTEGRSIELVQHAPETWPRNAPPRPAGAAGPVARRIRHAGILAGDLSAAEHFYHEVLGLTEIWRGSRTGTELSWVNLRV